MLVIAMLVLIVFGPQRLPEITRSVGKAMREFKKGMNEIQRELDVADRQQRWASPTPAAGTPTAAAAAAATAAGTASTDTEKTEGEAGASTGADASTADAAPPAPEPVIAPPTFGSDLPEEIEAQLAPAAVETAVIRQKPEPEGPQTAAPGRDDGTSSGDAGPEPDAGAGTDAGAASDSRREVEDPED
jgi:TatA/E family protein of Tat protein translocase